MAAPPPFTRGATAVPPGRSGRWEPYAALRTAAGHMQAIADPLADAIAKQFPDRFGS